MSTMTLSDISKEMRDIDFAMLSTHTPGGGIAARPMSNNGDVEYDGDSFFFALDHTHVVSEIERDPHVGLSLQGRKGLFGTPPIFIAVEGNATLIRDKAEFETHWTSDLDQLVRGGRGHSRPRADQGPRVAHPLLGRHRRGRADHLGLHCRRPYAVVATAGTVVRP